MDYSADSLRFLHIAYVLMALGQAGYVAFLLRRWSQVNSDASRSASQLKSGDA